jgi:hypothetical protein
MEAWEIILSCVNRSKTKRDLLIACYLILSGEIENNHGVVFRRLVERSLEIAGNCGYSTRAHPLVTQAVHYLAEVIELRAGKLVDPWLSRGRRMRLSGAIVIIRRAGSPDCFRTSG